MIAYGFKSAFGPAIATGAPDPKTLTLRAFRKPPSRHADVGAPIGLWTGMHTKEATRRGVGICVARCILRFGETGIRYASDVRIHRVEDELSTAIEREILDAANDAIARRDGFENWASLWAWHAANRDKAERSADSIARELVAWRPLTAAQIAAIDQGATLEGVG